MKIMLRAGIAVFTLGIGSAYAGDGDGYSATTLFTSIQNERVAPLHTVAAQPPTVATRNDGAAVQTSDARRVTARGCCAYSRCRSLEKAALARAGPRAAGTCAR